MPLQRSNVVGMIRLPHDATLSDQCFLFCDNPAQRRPLGVRDEFLTPAVRGLQPLASSELIEANLPRLRSELAVELNVLLERLRIAS